MQELTKWGNSMGYVIVGFTIFALGLFPYSVAIGSAGMTISCAVVQVVPLLVAKAPSTVSDSCDDLFEQLNESKSDTVRLLRVCLKMIGNLETMHDSGLPAVLIISSYRLSSNAATVLDLN